MQALLKGGIEPTNIGVMSPYKSQLKYISSLLASIALMLILENPAIDVMTIDKFQGKDKECVIISLVRCNDTLSVYYYCNPRLENYYVTGGG